MGGYLVALLLPVAFNPFAVQLFEAVKVPVFQVITVSMGIVATLAFIQKRDQHHGLLFRREGVRLALVEWFADNPLLLPALLYAGAYIMASLISIDPWRSFWGISTKHGTITVLSLVLFFLLIASALRTRAQVDRVITALILGSVPVAIYGWVQYFGLDPFDWNTPSLSPVHSTVGYSLFLGAYLAMVIPFTLFRILGGQSDGQKRPFPYILILVLQIMCLLFTLSRGARLGLLGGCLLFLWLLAYRWRMRRLFIFSVIVLIAGSYLFISMNKSLVVTSLNEQNGLIDALVVQAGKVSNDIRLELWIKTIPMISGRYLLGYGPETYSIAFWLYYPPESFPELAKFQFWDPHNIFLYQLTGHRNWI